MAREWISRVGISLAARQSRQKLRFFFWSCVNFGAGGIEGRKWVGGCYVRFDGMVKLDLHDGKLNLDSKPDSRDWSIPHDCRLRKASPR
jgi:hypothetical protein